jgi:hypothetical protein
MRPYFIAEHQSLLQGTTMTHKKFYPRLIVEELRLALPLGSWAVGLNFQPQAL